MYSHLFIYLICFIAANVTSHYVHGQIVPDLISTDHFLPYLTEQKKQEEIIKAYNQETSKKFPQTSDELYSHLYKYVDREYLGPVKGTSADPANAFPKYFDAIKSGSSATVPVQRYDLDPLMSQRNQMNMAMVEADIAAYESKQQQEAEMMKEIDRVFYKPVINYQLGLHTGNNVDGFINAYDELVRMLDGKVKADFLKAVWLVESAVDKTLTWEEFNLMFNDGVQVIGALMAKGKLSPNDNLAKIMTIYKYMTDTTKVYLAGKEKLIVSKPMLYDYEDYRAEKDLTKVFVSKLLRTGSGQCMSLPTLFFLFSKALNANAELAFAPEHSYITFKDKLGNRQNIELTGKMFTTTDFYWQTGFIKAEQVKSGIYLKPLSEKDVLVHLVTTLARAYVRSFGTDERLQLMAETARKHSPNDLSANMLIVGYYRDLYNNILRQYDVFRLSEADLENDQEAQVIKKKMYSALDHLKKDLGYAKMPDWAYQQWLNGVNELAQQRQHLVRKRELEQQLNR